LQSTSRYNKVKKQKSRSFRFVALVYWKWH